MDRAVTLRRDAVTTIARVVGSLLLAAMVLVLPRGEEMVDDAAHLEALVPRHSIAILTSARADLGDLTGRSRADQIIKAQRKEVSWLRTSLGDHVPVAPSEAPALTQV